MIYKILTKSNGFKYYSRKEFLLRIFWGFISPLWILSPRYFWFWRRWLIRLFGGEIADNVKIYPSAKVSQPWNLSIKKDTTIGWGAIIYAIGKIEIGEGVTISQRAHLCAGTHNIKDKSFPIIKSTIEIKDYVWIASEAFIGNGVKIGKNSVVGARSVVFSNISDNNVVIGNPAQIIKKR